MQKLTITRQTETHLVLRELPLLDYGIAFVVLITSLILLVANFWISAGIAAVIALYFIFQGKMRLICFDADAGKMLIHYQTPLKKETVSDIQLSDIQRAYLFKGDDEGTQIILLRGDAEEMGISAYSNDMTPWKDDIVIAINAILHEAYKANSDE